MWRKRRKCSYALKSKMLRKSNCQCCVEVITSLILSTYCGHGGIQEKSIFTDRKYIIRNYRRHALNIVCIVQCTVYRIQCTVYSVQCTAYSVQCTMYSVQCTVYSEHCTVNSVRFTVHCIQGSRGLCIRSALHTIHPILYVLYYTLYTTHCKLYTVYYTLYTSHYIRYTVYYTPYTEHCILYTVHYTQYIIHYILFTEYHTVYTIMSVMTPWASGQNYMNAAASASSCPLLAKSAPVLPGT